MLQAHSWAQSTWAKAGSYASNQSLYAWQGIVFEFILFQKCRISSPLSLRMKFGKLLLICADKRQNIQNINQGFNSS